MWCFGGGCDQNEWVLNQGVFYNFINNFIRFCCYVKMQVLVFEICQNVVVCCCDYMKVVIGEVFGEGCYKMWCYVVVEVVNDVDGQGCQVCKIYD